MGTPISVASPAASTVSCKVSGARSASACVTLRLRKIDSPSRSRITECRNCIYCAGSEASRPSRLRSAAISSAVAAGPNITAAGSPGMTWAITKTIVATRNITTTMPAIRRNRYCVMRAGSDEFSAGQLGVPERRPDTGIVAAHAFAGAEGRVAGADLHRRHIDVELRLKLVPQRHPLRWVALGREGIQHGMFVWRIPPARIARIEHRDGGRLRHHTVSGHESLPLVRVLPPLQDRRPVGDHEFDLEACVGQVGLNHLCGLVLVVVLH